MDFDDIVEQQAEAALNEMREAFGPPNDVNVALFDAVRPWLKETYKIAFYAGGKWTLSTMGITKENVNQKVGVYEKVK